MTENQRPDAGDYRRAAVLTLHHRRGDTDGVVVIAQETNAENRGPQLLRALLVLHQTLIGLLRTPSAINLIADWVLGMATLPAAEGPEMDTVRAAQLLNHHGQSNPQGIAEVMNTATAQGRPTELLMQLLDLYEVVLPELSGLGAIEWLSANIQTFVENEQGRTA